MSGPSLRVLSLGGGVQTDAMTAHERPHLARALLDVERQLVEERERRERAEWSQDDGYTWREATAVITHITRGPWVPEGFAMLSMGRVTVWFAAEGSAS